MRRPPLGLLRICRQPPAPGSRRGGVPLPRAVRAFVACAATVLAMACGAGDPPGSAAGEELEDEVAGAPGRAERAGPRLEGQAPPAREGIPAIVTLRPLRGPSSAGVPDPAASGDTLLVTHPAAPARGDGAVVDQFGLAFSPRVLIASEGAAVRFMNSEGAITHNVHLRSVAGDSSVFNGDTGPAEHVDVLLTDPGGYDVLCDMHPGMTGFVFLTDAPLAVVADTDGHFEVAGLPPGEYVARAWTVDGWGEERVVNPEAGTPPLDLRER